MKDYEVLFNVFSAILIGAVVFVGIVIFCSAAGNVGYWLIQ